MRVVIVEDSPSIFTLLRYNYEYLGHTVVACDRVQAALAKIEKELPDVAVVDIVLPDGDGRDIIRAIREKPGGSKVLVVVYSAYGPEEIGDVSGADVVVEKSGDVQELLNATKAKTPINKGEQP